MIKVTITFQINTMHINIKLLIIVTSLIAECYMLKLAPKVFTVDVS